MEVQHICKMIIFCFMLTSNHYQVISTRANNTSETNIVSSQLDLDNTVNDQVPAETAMSLEMNDQSYDVTKWVSFAGCGFWSFRKNTTLTETEKRFREYFKDGRVEADDMYDCSRNCSLTTNENLFLYFKGSCQCTGITSSDVNRDNRNCLEKCVHSIDVYCNGEYGLPIFEQHTLTPAGLTRIDGRLPRLNSLYIGQCLVQENGAYNGRQVSVCLQKIKSSTTCNKCNVIYPLLAGRFIQWICEEKLKYFRILFMDLDRTTENVLTNDREDGLPVATNSNHDKVSDLILKSTEKTTVLDTSVMTTNNLAVIIGNGVLFIAVLMVGTAYCIIRSRLRQSVQSGQHKTPENTEQNVMQGEANYDTIGSVAGSCPMPISNQTYKEVNI